MAEPAAKRSDADPPTPEPPSVVQGVDARGSARSSGDQAWLEGIHAMLAEAPAMTDDERRRQTLLGRLACALEAMSDQGVDPARIEQAIGAWVAARLRPIA
jgi:hypothetical protein